MKAKAQLDLWVDGNSIHNDERDECTPDFSCCQPELLAPLEVRQRFKKACIENDYETQHKMLMMFLGAALKDENIYIAGGLETDEHSS